MSVRLTYIGGPTMAIEIAGLRLLTDPTFDPAGSEYPTPVYVLKKTGAPALPATALGRVDAVLLSHDHHFDNLDRAGRSMLADAGVVITTEAGASRLGGNAIGLQPWKAHDIPVPAGSSLRIVATPARHGPPDGDRGPVIGFVLSTGRGDQTIYVSGDTVWFEGVNEVATRFDPAVAVLFAGAARVREVGPAHLTMTAAETVTAARAFARAAIVPVHCEGWAHFSESRADIAAAFEAAGLTSRLRWLEPGTPTTVDA